MCIWSARSHLFYILQSLNFKYFFVVVVFVVFFIIRCAHWALVSITVISKLMSLLCCSFLFNLEWLIFTFFYFVHIVCLCKCFAFDREYVPFHIFNNFHVFKYYSRSANPKKGGIRMPVHVKKCHWMCSASIDEIYLRSNFI